MTKKSEEKYENIFYIIPLTLYRDIKDGDAIIILNYLIYITKVKHCEEEGIKFSCRELGDILYIDRRTIRTKIDLLKKKRYIKVKGEIGKPLFIKINYDHSKLVETCGNVPAFKNLF